MWHLHLKKIYPKTVYQNQQAALYRQLWALKS